MWSVQSEKIKQNKKRVNYTINKQTIDRFKIVADKDMRKMSNIVENLIRRYVESGVQLFKKNGSFNKELSNFLLFKLISFSKYSFTISSLNSLFFEYLTSLFLS